MVPALRYEKTITCVVKKIGEKLTLHPSKRVVKNRFYKGPMSEYITKFDAEDLRSSGVPTETMVNLYQKYAAGGFGLVSTGMILVDENGRGMFPGNLIIGPDEDSTERREGFKALSAGIKPYGAVALGQIGNIADVYRYFALENVEDEAAVKDALKDGIYAAKFLSDCGFDGCSVAVFPGDLDKNKRLVKDLIGHMRHTVNNPAFVIGAKLNTARLQANYSKEETLKLLEAIDHAGYDFVEIAGGSYEFPVASAVDREDRFKEVLHEAKKHAKKTAVYVGGGMRRVKVMEKLLSEGTVDGITMARPTAAELDIPLKLIGNHVASTLVLPFEDDMMAGVLAAAAQANQAGQKPLTDANRDVNAGVMNLNDPEVLKKFDEAKASFVAVAEAAKTEGKVLPGVITVNL